MQGTPALAFVRAVCHLYALDGAVTDQVCTDRGLCRDCDAGALLPTREPGALLLVRAPAQRSSANCLLHAC